MCEKTPATLDHECAYKELARHVRERRAKLGLTQAEVAEKGGISKTGVAYIETERRVGWRVLGAVCWVLGIPLAGNYKRGESPMKYTS